MQAPELRLGRSGAYTLYVNSQNFYYLVKYHPLSLN